MEFSSQEYWSGLLLPPRADLPHPGIESHLLALADKFFTTEPPRISSVSKESACSAGDPGSIPGLGRSPGEGNGDPL